MDIYIKELAVHILDNTVGMPVVSSTVHPLNAEANDFVMKHIERIFEDGKLKETSFLGENNEVALLCEDLRNKEGLFLQVSQSIAEKLYTIMMQYLDISSADLVCAHAAIGEQPYLILLKLNYKTCFVHHLEYQEGQQVNSIVQHRTTLPSASQKIDEAVAINLQNLTVYLLEKKVELEGEKGFYLSPLLLNCGVDISSKEKIKVLEKVAKQVIDKYYGEEELEKAFAYKQAINESVEEKQEVSVEQVAEKVFGHIPQIKESFVQEVAQKGVSDSVIQIQSKREQEYYAQQRLITDTGIEIKLPVNEYDNKEKIEFLTNPDGTLSILIKNIKSIKK